MTETTEPTVTDTPTPTIEPTPTDLPYVLIPAGSFRYGSTQADVDEVVARLCSDYAESDPWCLAAAFEDEIPAGDMYVGSFYIDRYEVTNADYARCVAARTCTPPEREGANPRREYYYSPTYAEYAVVYVSWHDAQNYCTWTGGRLPTAEEWEKAARGTDGRWWPWGNTIPTYEANIRLPGEAAAAEENMGLVGGDIQHVGSYPEDRSVYGIMDMSGNVMEWVDAKYPGDGTKRQIRGGSWNTGSFSTRTASLVGVGPNRLFFDVGFRCARDASP
jgi:formylglycine-generating enzyme required for sulfatase activity